MSEYVSVPPRSVQEGYWVPKAEYDALQARVAALEAVERDLSIARHWVAMIVLAAGGEVFVPMSIDWRGITLSSEHREDVPGTIWRAALQAARGEEG